MRGIVGFLFASLINGPVVILIVLTTMLMSHWGGARLSPVIGILIGCWIVVSSYGRIESTLDLLFVTSKNLRQLFLRFIAIFLNLWVFCFLLIYGGLWLGCYPETPFHFADLVDFSLGLLLMVLLVFLLIRWPGNLVENGFAIGAATTDRGFWYRMIAVLLAGGLFVKMPVFGFLLTASALLIGRRQSKNLFSSLSSRKQWQLLFGMLAFYGFVALGSGIISYSFGRGFLVSSEFIDAVLMRPHNQSLASPEQKSVKSV
jgi:hypothetical protein